jgi:hypothetical protein
MVDTGAGVLLSVFFELLLEVVDEDSETACSVSGRSNDRDGLVAGWPKTSRRGKTRAVTLSSSKADEIWQWQHRGRVSLFIAQGNATVNDPAVATRGSIMVDP